MIVITSGKDFHGVSSKPKNVQSKKYAKNSASSLVLSRNSLSVLV